MTIKDLSLVFKQNSSNKQDFNALNKINLSIEKGEFVGLVGESGCGKTITALASVGLLPKNAKIIDGSVLFNGQDLLKLSQKEMQKILGNKISIVFQDPMTTQNPLIKIGKQITETGIIHGQTKEHAIQKAYELLSAMGVANPEYICSLYPKDLSGGMLQRVMIASSLMNDPDLLIADEPTTSLDVTIQAEILDLLTKLNKKNGTSMLLISHDLAVVSKICNKLYIMKDGEIVESGNTKDVLFNGKKPYTQELVNAVFKFATCNKEKTCKKNTNSSLIECFNLSKEFCKSKTEKIVAVNNIDFCIKEGTCYGLVGESSCGKSTLANLIVKLIEPTSGNILFCQKDIHSFTKIEQSNFRRNVQIIFQNPVSSVNPKMKIKDILEEPLLIHKIGKTKKERDLLVNEMRTLCGISREWLEMYPRQLSGGQLQRVAICAALILKPKLLIFDEAIASLDAIIQTQILAILKKMQKSLNLTYLFISHNLNAVAYLADRIGVMYLGNLVEEACTANIVNSPKHPYTKALFSASFNIDETQKERIILKGELPDPTNPPQGCPFCTRCPQCKDICKTQKPPKSFLENDHFVSCFLTKFD